MRFFLGIHDIPHAAHVDACMISVKRLARMPGSPPGRGRKSDFVVHDWMLDSGAFTEIRDHGDHRLSPEAYADQINRWSRCGNLLAASAQDYMCEDFVLQITGLSIADHQRLTIERYRALRPLVHTTHVLPVIQGYAPSTYVEHIRQYGELLEHGAWVGVGSVCKRNARVSSIEEVLIAIHQERPDLRLHGFGVKTTALKSQIVHDLLYSSDSMAWNYGAWRQGRKRDDIGEALRFKHAIESQQPRARQFQYRMELE